LGYAYAYLATGEQRFYDAWCEIASFMLSCQIYSNDKLLDGAWTRAFDVENWEAHGVPHDVGWAPCCIETGWTMGEILMGLEFKFRENGNDYLVFGFTREYIESLDFEIFIGLKDFAEVVRKDGIFIAQAHPFRFGMTLMKPNLLDGIEVFNGHFYHNSHNFLAEAYADSHNMIKTSGTDHHDPEHTPNGGILTDVEIKTETQLIEILKSGKYELIKC